MVYRWENDLYSNCCWNCLKEKAFNHTVLSVQGTIQSPCDQKNETKQILENLLEYQSYCEL
jgi:hypothetical protein